MSIASGSLGHNVLVQTLDSTQVQSFHRGIPGSAHRRVVLRSANQRELLVTEEGSTEITPITLDFGVDEGFGSRARLGLIVLESDQTIEPETGSINLDGVAIYHSRIANELHVTPATLMAMKARLPAAAALLPTEFEFDAIAYGCTSASTFIGDDAVAEAITASHPNAKTTNPITASIAAFGALGAKRIRIVTPYSAVVTEPVVNKFSDAGFEVVTVGSFLEQSDLVVARISESSVAAAVRQVTAATTCDAVFVSCTSVRGCARS